jgi:hypothetical protein
VTEKVLSSGENSPLPDSPPPTPNPQPTPTPTPRRSLLGRMFGVNTPENSPSDTTTVAVVEDVYDEQEQLKREEFEEKARISAEVAKHLNDRLLIQSPEVQLDISDSTDTTNKLRRISFTRRKSTGLEELSVKTVILSEDKANNSIVQKSPGNEV